MPKKMIISVLILVVLATLVTPSLAKTYKVRYYKAKYKKVVKLQKRLKKAKKVVSSKSIYKPIRKTLSITSSLGDKYYIAPAQQVTDLNAGKPQVAPENQVTERVVESSADLFADITTNFSFDVNARQAENAPVDGVDVAANFTASKGPAYFQYSHSRNYSRSIDPFYSTTPGDFAGSINNKFTIGFNLATAPVVASTPVTTSTVASAPAPVVTPVISTAPATNDQAVAMGSAASN
jgi:hypothetical protein